MYNVNGILARSALLKLETNQTSVRRQAEFYSE